MSENKCALKLRSLVFDKLEFERKGFKNEQELNLTFQVQVGISNDAIYKVTMKVLGDKNDEYSFEVCASGFFEIDANAETSSELKNSLINKNAVAIMMPFVRSEISILTAQPETDCVVIPPFNINAVMDEQDI